MPRSERKAPPLPDPENGMWQGRSIARRSDMAQLSSVMNPKAKYFSAAVRRIFGPNDAAIRT